MKHFFSKLFSIFPSGALKDFIRVIVYNCRWAKEFSIRKKNKIWIARYPGFSLKFSPDIVPYHVLLTNYIFLHHFPKEPIDYFVDGGAYIGSLSLLVTKKFNNIKQVIALEPDPVNRSILENNFKLNDLSGYKILPIGLWSKRDTLTFYSGNQLASSVYQNSDIENSIQIEVDSLNNLLKGVSGKRIFIKMNIEGAELEALSACSEVIENNRVHLAIAADHTVNGQLTCEKVQELCRGMNLSVTTFTRDKIITVYASNEYKYDSGITL